MTHLVLSVEQLVGFQWHIFIFEMENFSTIVSCFFFLIAFTSSMKNISMFVESGSFEEEEFRLCVLKS